MYRGDFLEDNNNTITYDKNWQNVTRPEYPKLNLSEPEKQDKPPETPKVNIPKQYLLSFQLIACVLVGIAAFVLKSVGGDTYNAVRQWYYSQLNNTAVYDGCKQIDLDLLLGRATPDEAADK